MTTHIIEITKVRIDAGTQSRASISEETVAEYHEAIESGASFPPIVTYYDGLHYYVADGFHRYLAHKRSKLDMIECEVRGGTVRDAVLYSLSANAEHGLRRTNADKRKAVLTALNDPEWSDLSTRELAEICAVSHAYISKIKGETVNVYTPPKEKPKVQKPKEEGPNIIEPIADRSTDDAVQDLLAMNEQLSDRLAVEAMDASEEEKTLAKETIDSLRNEVKILRVELDAVKKSRDQYQLENGELKKQIKMLQRQLKK